MPSAGRCGDTGLEELNVSLAQASEVCSINNCVVLGKCCKKPSVAARAVGVFSGSSRSHR